MSQSGKLILHELAVLAQSQAVTPAAEQAALEAVLDLVTAVAAAPRCGLGPALRSAHGPGPGAIWFTGETAAPTAAGFANALAGAALDLDDGHRKSRGHPGAAVIPAVLAQADRLTADGRPPEDRDIVRAIVLGYEIGLRIAAARSFYARTGFWGGFAAAAGAGVLVGLEINELAHALAIAGETGPHMATTTAPPAWPQPNGSHVKEGIPWGVATGLAAVPLAQAGITGALDLVDHAPFFDAEAILADRAGPAICETYTKFHAACRHVHAPVEAFLALAHREDIPVDSIEAIEVAAYSGALRIPNRPDPRNLVDAQYSIPYCIGLVARHGADALLPMTKAALHDRACEDLARRVTVRVDTECEARFPDETPVRVTIRTAGRTVTSPITTPSGEASARPNWEERLRKFRIATQATLSPKDQERFMKAFSALRQGRIAPVRQLLSVRLAALPEHPEVA